jgi:hypothetical protein
VEVSPRPGQRLGKTVLYGLARYAPTIDNLVIGLGTRRESFCSVQGCGLFLAFMAFPEVFRETVAVNGKGKDSGGNRN